MIPNKLKINHSGLVARFSLHFIFYYGQKLNLIDIEFSMSRKVKFVSCQEYPIYFQNSLTLQVMDPPNFKVPIEVPLQVPQSQNMCITNSTF